MLAPGKARRPKQEKSILRPRSHHTTPRSEKREAIRLVSTHMSPLVRKPTSPRQTTTRSASRSSLLVRGLPIVANHTRQLTTKTGRHALLVTVRSSAAPPRQRSRVIPALPAEADRTSMCPKQAASRTLEHTDTGLAARATPRRRSAMRAIPSRYESGTARARLPRPKPRKATSVSRPQP